MTPGDIWELFYYASITIIKVIHLPKVKLMYSLHWIVKGKDSKARWKSYMRQKLRFRPKKRGVNV